MGVGIRYMGTKRQLAPIVREVVSGAQNGVLLDAFSGMCAVGQTVAPDRQVWTNDIQAFSTTVARMLFQTQSKPLSILDVAAEAFEYFEINQKALSKRFAPHLKAEESTLLRGKLRPIAENFDLALERHDRRHTKSLREELSSHKQHFPYRLFTIIYGNTYLGWRQCIELDSIIYAINALARKRRIVPDQKNWLLIALGQAVARTATTTGHFAQFLRPNKNNVKRFVGQRSRLVWGEWLQALHEIEPVGTRLWRSRNECFNSDSLLLLPRLLKSDRRPSVIYADPPYTDDQYSRFYHFLETLVLYDYPDVSGFARYRAARFQTPFSQRARVHDAFDKLVRHSSELGSDLILSYPQKGLLESSPVDTLKAYYSRVEVCGVKEMQHSTFGASKGPASSKATEFIYWARQ